MQHSAEFQLIRSQMALGLGPKVRQKQEKEETKSQRR
jgi:hypothetical protein